MKYKIYIVSLVMILVAFASGCGNEESQEEQVTHRADNGDLRELTADASTSPDFLNEKDETIQVIYELAPHYKQVLESVPCYCGCGESAGHRDNYDCFVHENKEDGGIVWDDHGTRCGVCLEIAASSMQMSKDGKSLKEIRDSIDSKYNNSDYAKPTPTPMPEA
ncbi:PCYCGC motif-containing (lipo)protein [Pseudalkalibacillus caeni]|uniref:Lipoprotein n=1 Tax=Exobacillus caeni TaxID=2574798 RepID=A0A5R9F304_9BACL|nr:PCYCGC motif-containing (lipo)protein [Pseudalkalibacillus caeni]TLS38062.1 hypothetical protein FCL54_05830 [Pseudalkalibacillus caeni]